MRGTVNQLARTLALANRFITEQLEQHGLAGIAPSHGDIFVQLFAHGELPMCELAQRIGRDPSTVTALVKREQVRQYESAAVVERGFGGSLPAFVAAFLREKKLSPQEADELRRMLDESEGGHD